MDRHSKKAIVAISGGIDSAVSAWLLKQQAYSLIGIYLKLVPSQEKNEEFADAHVFLAKAYMDTGRDLRKAEELAQRGLKLEPEKRAEILGHFVLADIYNRMGRPRDSQRHVSMAKELQRNL